MAATDSGAESTPVKPSGCPFGHGASTSAAPQPATPTQQHHHHHHGPTISNVESFVVSTVPLVPGTRDGHFALADLWASFEEWSAYGVEVPLVLDEDDDGAEGDGEVFQYYVPFLSGIQIFVDAPVEDDGARSTAPPKIDDDDDDKTKTKTKVSGGLLSPGAARVRVEAPTEVDARCAARATREPKTMMHFFQKRDREQTAGEREQTDPGKHSETRKRPAAAPAFVPAVASSRKPRVRGSTQPTIAFATGSQPASQPGRASNGGAPQPTGPNTGAERQRCPICDLAFPGTWLNGDVNAHIDECIANTVL
mmetsp:Transcript_1140/g.4915  ORF Transcript_1140/g.4915 Transcript_1140/m.4915 type:complete len:309 (-) Transcript_1140:465-1391(-)